MRSRLLFASGLSVLIIVMMYGIMHGFKKNTSYAAQTGYSKGVAVDAFIGEYQFTLYGYSSPNALITLEGMGIYDQTYSNKSGYFEFKNRFSPLSPREACLTSQDAFGRTTSPNCLPPFPIKYNVSIGPVIMPPTVSLNAANYYQGDEVILSGQSIPNMPITFSTFVDEKKSLLNYISRVLTFPKPVNAFTFPQLTATTDDKGNFTLSIPSSHSNFFRLFAQTLFDSAPSPQSINLNLTIFPVWMVIIKFLLLLWSILMAHLLELIILVELITITVFIMRRYTHPHVVAKNRALALRKLYTIVKEDLSIIIPENHPLALEKHALMRRSD